MRKKKVRSSQYLSAVQNNHCCVIIMCMSQRTYKFSSVNIKRRTLDLVVLSLLAASCVDSRFSTIDEMTTDHTMPMNDLEQRNFSVFLFIFFNIIISASFFPLRRSLFHFISFVSRYEGER